MSRVALTGCSSHFAQVLLPLLEEDKDIEQIIGIDRVAPTMTSSKLIFHERDVRDPQIGELFANCDALVHLAFVVARPYSLSLQETADINLRGTWNTCEAAAKVGVKKIVVSSSVASYGSLPDNPNPLTEESSLRGLYTRFYYSQHKHANELWLDTLQLKYPNMLLSRLRPSIVIGPHQSGTALLIQPNNTHFFGPSDRNLPLQLVHEDDLAAAFHVMLHYDLTGAYNVVGDEPEPRPILAQKAGLQAVEVPDELIREQVISMWKSGKSPMGPEWLGDGETSILCSNAKLKATGYWSPRYTTAEALRATAQEVNQTQGRT